MMKRLFLCLAAAALLLSCCPPAGAVSGANWTVTETGFTYSFEDPENPYLLLTYKTSTESGTYVLTGQNGRYEGEVPLRYSQGAKTVRIEVKTPAGKSTGTASLGLMSAAAPAAVKQDAGAAAKVRDLALTPGDHAIGLRFTAPGHHQVTVTVSSVMQKAQYVLNETEDGVFSDTILLPCVNQRDLVKVTVKSVRNKELAAGQERTLFVIPDAGETAAEGPLSGVKVCIDPGHQALQVKAGTVYQYPGASKRVSGGNSTMAQGIVTYRKESVGVLEISYRLCRMLREQGAEVVMTRWVEDTAVTNMERAEYANAENADYCLRIHLNNSSQHTNNAVYAYGPLNSPYAKEALPFEQYRDTAQTILDGLKESTGVQGGVVRMSDQFVGNNWTRMPTFLLECGFLSTPANDWILTTADYQDKIARGIVNGLIDVVQGRLRHFVKH